MYICGYCRKYTNNKAKQNKNSRSRALASLVLSSIQAQQKSNKNKNKNNKNKNNKKNLGSFKDQQAALVISGAQSVMRTRSRVPRQLSILSLSQRKYLLCQKNPFHPDAIDVRVPGIPLPNSTPVALRFSAVINPAFSTGLATNFFIPSVGVYGYFTNNQNFTASNNVTFQGTQGTVAMTTYNGTTHQPSGIIYDGNANSIGPYFGNQFSAYRVVGGGVRLSSLSATSSTASVVNVESLPLVNAPVTYSTFSGAQAGSGVFTADWSQAQLDNILTAVSTGAVVGAINDTRRTYTSYEMLDDVIIAPFVPLTENAHRYKDSSDQAHSLGGATYGDEEYVTGGSIYQGGHKAQFEMEGWCGVRFSHTNSSAPFMLDYILHLEAIPTGVENSSIFPQSGSNRSDVNNQYGLQNLINMAKDVGDWVMFAHRVYNGSIGNLSREVQRLRISQGDF